MLHMFFAAAALATCDGVALEAGCDQYPTAYESALHAYLESTLKDPDTAIVKLLRGPRRTIGRLGAGGFSAGTKWSVHTVCYRVNAKNSYGGFVGYRTLMLTFRMGSLQKTDWSPGSPVGDGLEVDRADVLNECAQPADDRPAVPASK